MASMIAIIVLGTAWGIGLAWFAVQVLRALREITLEMRGIRRDLQEVRGKVGTLSAPLDSMKKIVGMGGSMLHGSPDK